MNDNSGNKIHTQYIPRRMRGLSVEEPPKDTPSAFTPCEWHLQSITNERGSESQSARLSSHSDFYNKNYTLAPVTLQEVDNESWGQDFAQKYIGQRDVALNSPGVVSGQPRRTPPMSIPLDQGPARVSPDNVSASGDPMPIGEAPGKPADRPPSVLLWKKVKFVPVSQLDRVPDFEPEGRGGDDESNPSSESEDVDSKSEDDNWQFGVGGYPLGGMFFMDMVEDGDDTATSGCPAP
jgi:hypothetical protein